MARVVFTLDADADSAHIIADLAAQAGPHVADRYEADFDAEFVRLAEYPESGAPRKKLGSRVRMCVVWPYAIIYDYAESEDTVTIMRIVHGRRNITSRLLSQT